MYTILFYSTTYILLFYIFMLVRGTIPRYKVTTMLSLFWRILLLYATIFLMVITMVTIL